MRPAAASGEERELARLAKAIGHPARVQILRFLAGRTACMCGDIVDELPLAQSTVSQHLKILKEAGLIRGEVDVPEGLLLPGTGRVTTVQGSRGRAVRAGIFLI